MTFSPLYPHAVVISFPFAELAMNKYHIISKMMSKIRNHLHRERDFRDKDESHTPHGQRLIGGSHIDFRLSAPCHPFKEDALELLFLFRLNNLFTCLFLLFRQFLMCQLSAVPNEGIGILLLIEKTSVSALDKRTHDFHGKPLFLSFLYRYRAMFSKKGIQENLFLFPGCFFFRNGKRWRYPSFQRFSMGGLY